ncbi:MAG: hypothetical protein IT464_03820 [Planctomycetes bacterium]|nr:hypothetical protein [Planctomycetota bacterium]
MTDEGSEEAKSITEVGRELLKYLHKRLEDLGMNQASYRQARMELLRILERNREKARFNWGFEAVFTQEIHTLEELGLISVKYGSGAIMAGRTSPNSIYNVALTDDGKDTARVILERETRARAETSKLEKGDGVEDEEDELDETDREPESTKVSQAELDKPDEETNPPPLPGDASAKP